MTATTKETPPPSVEIIPAKQPAIVDIVAPLDIGKLAEAFKKFEDFKRRLLTDDDSVSIQGRPYLKKPAWRKWALACGVSDRLLSQERVPATGADDKGNYYYKVVVEAYHIPTGRTAVGIAIASRGEKAKWVRDEHDILTLAHTRAKNRAIADLVGGGEVSAEEIELDHPSSSQSVSQPAVKKPAAGQSGTSSSTWTDRTA